MKRKRVPFHVEYDRSGRIIRTLYTSGDPSEAPSPTPSEPEPAPKVARGVQGNLL